MTNKSTNYGIDIRDALARRGIENAHQLWTRIGGSKGTAALLWSGSAKQIQMETMNKLHQIVGIVPSEYIVNRAPRPSEEEYERRTNS